MHTNHVPRKWPGFTEVEAVYSVSYFFLEFVGNFPSNRVLDLLPEHTRKLR